MKKWFPILVLLALLCAVSLILFHFTDRASSIPDVVNDAAVDLAPANQARLVGQPEAQPSAPLSSPSWRPAAVFAETGAPTPQILYPRGENATRRYHDTVTRELAPELASQNPALLAKSPEDGRFNLLPEEIDDHTLVAGRMVLDTAALDRVIEGRTSRLLAPTLTGEVMTLGFQKIKTRSANTHTMQGHVVGEESTSYVQIVYHDGILFGNVRRYNTNQEFEYRILADGHMMVREIDLSTMTAGCEKPPEIFSSIIDENAPPEEMGEYVPDKDEPIANSTPGWRTVDVAIGYDKEARIADGGFAQIEARIIASVDNMTTAFANSGIANAEMMLLGTIEDPDYLYSNSSASNMGAEITDLRSEGNGRLDAVTNFSNRLGADFTSFVIRQSRGGTSGVASAGKYSILARTYALTVLSHEMGHNLGCTHGWGETSNSVDNSRYGWRFKSPVSGNRYQTLMSYGWGGSFVLHYSNPNIFYDGARTGAVDGYNVLGDATADPALYAEGTISGYDGTNPALGANNAEVIDDGDPLVGTGLTYNAARSTRTAFNVVNPVAGSQWERGSTQTIRFNGGDMDDLATIKLFKGGVLHSTLASAINPGIDRDLVWTVPFALTNGTDYMVRVELTSHGSTLIADSGIFTIFSDPPYVTTTSTPAVPQDIGQISKAILTFNVPMDPATFSVGSDIVSFTDAIGNSVLPSITGASWSAANTVLTIDFTPSSQPGAYRLVIGPNIADTFGFQMDQDRDGASGENPDDRHIVQFTVNPPLIYQANMDTNPGWTFSSNNPATNGWAYGQPTGQGPNPYRGNDPTAGYTGANVIGYNLDGDYQTSIPDTRWATTPAINCSAQRNVTLSFQRWLGMSSNDFAYIQVSNNGSTWTTVWQNPDNANFDDNAWIPVSYNISAVADGQATVHVRWGLGQTFTNFNGGASGWNIDDVVVSGALADALVLTPAGGLASSGEVGGPFSPASLQYTLQNNGTSTVQWTAAKTSNWVDLSAVSGSLAAGASTTVTVSINSNTNIFAAGDYTDLITFTNATAGVVTATRSVNLDVRGPGTLEITPPTDFTSEGPFSGPFSPTSTQYTLTNGGVTTINWTASNIKDWVTLSASSGTLAPGASTTVTVSINSNADALNPGTQTDTVAFVNTTNGSGDDTRGVSLLVNPPPANIYWDGNVATAGAGGNSSGTWGITNNWNTNSTGGAGTFSSATANTSNLFFVAGPGSGSGSSNTSITVSGSRFANSITCQYSANFTLVGGTVSPLGTITLGNSNAGQGGITVNEFAYGSTAQGKLSISAPVILNNSQTWTNNKVDTTVTQATPGLEFTAVTGIANGLTLNHALTIDGKGVTSLSAATTTTITGTGSITKNGTGTLILSTVDTDNSSWSGGLTINGGVVRYQNAANLKNNLGTGNINLAGGVLEGRSGTTSNLTTLTLGSAANQIRITGGVSGFSAQSSTATIFNLGSSVTWGTTNFNPSEFVLQASTAGSGGAATFSSNINLGSGTRTIRSDQPGSLTSGGVATFSGVISGASGNLIKTGPGHVFLTASNTYGGTTAINQGTVTANFSSSVQGISTPGRVTVAAGATLGANMGTLIATSIDNMRNNVTWSDKTSRLGFMTATAGLDYTSNITQPLSVHKYGASSTLVLRLSGNSSYTGHTIISQGVLEFTSIANVGGGNSSLGAPATVDFGTIALGGDASAVTLRYVGTTGHSTDRVINLCGTTGSATLEMAGTGTLTFTSALTAAGAGSKTLTLSGATAGIGVLQGAIPNNSSTNTTSISKTGNGTWELTGASSYSGTTTIGQGTLVFNSIANVSGGNSALGAPTTTANGTIALGNSTNNVALKYTGTGHSTNRVINLAGTIGSATLDMSGTGTLTFSSPLTATGAGAKTLTLAGSTTGVGEFGGAIVNNSGTNTTAVTKTGSGIWILSGNNSYTGATAVNAGKLLINGNQSTATSNVSVAANATLGGTGTIGGDTTIADGGKLEFNISTAAASHNPLDLIAGKTLTFSGASTLTITSTSGASPGTYTLITGGNPIIGPAPTAPNINLPANWVATVSISGNSLLLNLASTSASYTVTYNSNSATSGTAPSNQTKNHDVALTLATNSGNLARAGYTFAGWNTQANGSGTNYAVGANYTANAPLTLFAKWTMLPYTAWASSYAPNFTDTALSSNPDGDAFINLLEYAFGTDPTSPITGPLIYTIGQNSFITGSPILLNFAAPAQPADYRAVFARRIDHLAAGLTYTVEFSADLSLWTASSVLPTVLTNSGAMEAVSVPFLVTVPRQVGGSAPPTFFRILVSGN